MFTVTLDHLLAKPVAAAAPAGAHGVRFGLALVAVVVALLAVRLLGTALRPFAEVIRGALAALGGVALILLVIVLLVLALLSSTP
jgi:hypothetical protein